MERLIHQKEPLYFGISVIVSVLIYAMLAVSIVGLAYAGFFAAFAFLAQGLFVGNLKGNAVRVSERQFPDIHQSVLRLCNKMELSEAPDVYIVQSGGVLNAFALQFIGRNFVAINSDVLELAYQNGEPAVGFILAHELAHLKRKHVSRRFWILPAMLFPFLGKAYSRACEYTCDSFAAHHRPDGASSGLLVLAAGKRLYAKVDIGEFKSQLKQTRGFWAWYSELLSTHPFLCNRLGYLQDTGLI